MRLNKYLSTDSKRLAVNSFTLSNFNYCPLVWNFASSKSINRVEKIQERALRIINNDNISSYSTLLENHKKTTIKVKNLQILATEIFKTLQNINPSYIKDIFQISNNRTSSRLKYNIKSQSFKKVKFGKKSLRILGPILWNSLPNNLKSISSINSFKSEIKKWGQYGCPHYHKFNNYMTSIK